MARPATTMLIAILSWHRPLDESSGEMERHRVNPAGNRQLNWAIYIAAIVQICHGTGRDYYRRKAPPARTGVRRCAV